MSVAKGTEKATRVWPRQRALSGVRAKPRPWAEPNPLSPLQRLILPRAHIVAVGEKRGVSFFRSLWGKLVLCPPHTAWPPSRHASQAPPDSSMALTARLIL